MQVSKGIQAGDEAGHIHTLYLKLPTICNSFLLYVSSLDARVHHQERVVAGAGSVWVRVKAEPGSRVAMDVEMGSMEA